jgi:penicillin-binding protein 1A
MDNQERPEHGISPSITPRKPWQIAILAVLGLGFAGIALLSLLSLILTPTLPSPDELRGGGQLKVPMRVYTADGVLIGEFGEERRLPRKIDEVPPLLIKAILAAEDAGYYDHHGVSFLGIARAAWINFQSGGHRQGASTITMQVARNFFLSPEKTYTRKLKEVLLAFKLERDLTKNDILELYINKIYLGHRAYGFAAASRIYYGKPLADLTLPEMAMLSGLPKAPSRNNPLTNPETARDRRNYIMSRMYKQGYIDEVYYRDIRFSPLTARKHKLKYDIEAPYIAEMVRQYMLKTYKNKVYAGGFHVYTTINSKYQQAANKALRSGLLAYERRHGYRGPSGHIKIRGDIDKSHLDITLKDYRAIGNLIPGIVMLSEDKSITVYTQDGYVASVNWSGLSWARKYIDANAAGPNPKSATNILRVGDVVYLENIDQGRWLLAQPPQAASAFVALDPKNGGILALSGGFDFRQSKFNRVIQAKRQPGSNIKPFIYSSALEKGFTAASTISGAPITIEDVNLEDVWRPENYSGKFFGPTRLRKALTLSLNLVSVRLLRAIKPSFAVKYLTRFGFDSKTLPSDLSLALGSASVKPITMVRAFSVFANGGFLVDPYFISRVEDGNHKILEYANPTLVCNTCPETKNVVSKYLAQEATLDTKAKEAQKETSAEAGQAPAAQEPPAIIRLVENEPTEESAENKNGQKNTNINFQPQPKRLAPRTITSENAYVMTSIMQDVIKHGTSRRALVLNRPNLAGKTGTTNEFRDAWFSGFNDQIVATAWLGYDQPETLGRGEAGSRTALPIWIDFMRVALEDMPENVRPKPASIVTRFINKETGQPTGPDDPDGIDEHFFKRQQTESAAARMATEDTGLTAPTNTELGPEEGAAPTGQQQIPEDLF